MTTTDEGPVVEGDGMNDWRRLTGKACDPCLKHAWKCRYCGPDRQDRPKWRRYAQRKLRLEDRAALKAT